MPAPVAPAAPASIMQPVANGGQPQIQPPSAQLSPAAAPLEQPKRKPSTGGWNDPPPINPNRIPKKKKV